MTTERGSDPKRKEKAVAVAEVEAEKPFDLDAIIKEELDNGNDVQTTNECVLKRIPDEYVRVVLAALLPEEIRRVSNRRLNAAAARPPSSTAPRSAKWDNVKWARRVLSLTLRIGPNQAKVLGECTQEDVAAAVAIRRDVAAHTLSEADRYERLREKMQMHRAIFVRDLSPELLAEALRDEVPR